jgi:hypothetical protein
MRVGNHWVFGTTAVFISLRSPLDFWTPKIGTLQGLLQGITNTYCLRLLFISLSPFPALDLRGYCFWLGRAEEAFRRTCTGAALSTRTICPSVAHTLGSISVSTSGRIRVLPVSTKTRFFKWSRISCSSGGGVGLSNITMQEWENKRPFHSQLKG